MRTILSFCGETVMTAAARHGAVAALKALKDRDLADMGLDRDGIDVFVRETWPWPDLPIAHRPHHRPLLQGCG